MNIAIITGSVGLIGSEAVLSCSEENPKEWQLLFNALFNDKSLRIKF